MLVQIVAQHIHKRSNSSLTLCVAWKPFSKFAKCNRMLLLLLLLLLVLSQSHLALEGLCIRAAKHWHHCARHDCSADGGG
jgi:hypothetical protein